VSDGIGNYSIYTHNINVFADPVPDFSANPTATKVNYAVAFTDLSNVSAKGNVTYNWSFGDLGISPQPFSDIVGDVTHVYIYPGIYDVNLTITSDSGTQHMLKRQYISIAESNAASGQSSNVIWTPHQVVFQCLDGNNNPIPNTRISAQAAYSTLPGGLDSAVSMVESAYGLPASAATQLINSTTTMSGYTDRSGMAVFVMLPVLDYAVTFTDTGGQNFTTSIMPQDAYYILSSQNAATTSEARKQIVYNQNLANSVYNTTFSESSDKSTGTMSSQIYDSTGQISGANCWFTLVDNSTTWWDNRSWALGSGLQTISKSVPIVPYQQWQWGCDTI
jgi:PKD repeat protein